MTTFDEINQQHQALLIKRESLQEPAELVEEARAFLQEIEAASARIVNPREREQVRSIIRYWAAFLFDQTHVYPQTNLQPPDPSLVQAAEPAPERGFLAFLRERLTPVNLLLVLLFILLVFVVGIVGGNYISFPSTSAGRQTQTIAIQTVEAIMLTSTRMAINPTESSGQVTTHTPELEVTSTLATALPATATQAASETPQPSYTPERPDRTATQSATAIIALPTATKAPNQPGYSSLIPVLDLPTSSPSNLGAYACTSDSIRVSVKEGIDSASNKNLANAWAQAVLQVIPVGSSDLPYETRPSAEGDAVFSLVKDSAPQERYYLLHVESPGFESLDIIFLYSKGCQQAEMVVGYILGEKELVGSKGLTQVGELGLGWRLLTWGPVPGTEVEQWAALLQLEGTGGNRNYVYWETQQGNSTPVTGDQVLLTGNACQVGEKIVGVTSAGQAATRLVRILAPYCPGQIQELLPAP